MKDAKTVDHFIELRSQGISFSRIASELKVSKNTLIEWSRKFHLQIENLRRIESEARVEQYFSTRKERCQVMANELQKFQEELAKRDLGDLSTARLLDIIHRLRDRIDREDVPVKFAEPPPPHSFSQLGRRPIPFEWIA